MGTPEVVVELVEEGGSDAKVSGMEVDGEGDYMAYFGWKGWQRRRGVAMVEGGGVVERQ